MLHLQAQPRRQCHLSSDGQGLGVRPPQGPSPRVTKRQTAPRGRPQGDSGSDRPRGHPQGSPSVKQPPGAVPKGTRGQTAPRDKGQVPCSLLPPVHQPPSDPRKTMWPSCPRPLQTPGCPQGPILGSRTPVVEIATSHTLGPSPHLVPPPSKEGRCLLGEHSHSG